MSAHLQQGAAQRRDGTEGAANAAQGSGAPERPPMAFAIRPAELPDLEALSGVFQRSVNHLRQKHGFAPMTSVGPPRFATFSLADDRRGLWVARSGETFVGFAFSWVCDDFWFLAQLFVDPDVQARGVGRILLEKTLEQAQACNAGTRALITFAYNPFSTGLYAQHGLHPHIPLYRMSAPTNLLKGRLGHSDCTCLGIEPSAASIEVLSKIDDEVLGFRRDKHHLFSAQSGVARAFLIQRAGHDLGYAYIAPSGHVGPVALRDASACGDAMTAVLRRAAELNTERVSAVVPGPAAACMDAAVAAGMRIGEPLVLVTSKPFGDWGRYLPRDPAYM
jgi:GNAT superfamily N-acetyltransferase